ncbi:MAG TPA: ATP-binding protein [Acidimicrobiia bacterium]|nr:ATP-binding protein [Acidimicrobiia bacterium]
MTITRRLVIVIGLFFLVLASRTVFFDRSMVNLREQTLVLANDTLVREEVAEAMTAAANDLALITTSYVASPQPDLLDELADVEAEFREAHDAFSSHVSSRDLSDAALTVNRQFDDLIRQSQRLIDAVDRRTRLRMAGTTGELTAISQAIDVYLARFHVLRTAIAGTLDDVIAPATDADVTEAQNAISTAIGDTRTISLGLALAAGLVLIGAVWMIERRIAQPTRRLAEAAGALAEGFSLPPLPADNDDEIGRLTNAFNVMVSRQTETMHALEAANEEMTTQYERLRELDRLKDHFVATVSHELRTPLTSIVGYTELLTDGSVGELDAEQLQFLEVVSRNAYRLQRMVDDLLLAARIDAGTLRLEKAPFDLSELLVEAVESALPVAEDKGVEIRFRPIDPLTMVGDRTRIGQAIDNLLNNAIKFSPPRGTIELRGGSTAAQATVEVTDAGVGIPEEELARVFDRFYRSSTSNSVPGTGIGLSIVSYVAQAHDGSVRVRSEMGMGSTFTMVLPRSNGSSPPEESQDA